MQLPLKGKGGSNVKKKPISYLALGDSLTEGVGASTPEHNLVSQFFRHLKKGEKCIVRNFGVSGMKTDELLTFVQNPAVLRFLPKATHISITTGGNDFIEVYEKYDDFSVKNFKHVIQTMKVVKTNAKKIIEVIRGANNHAVIHLLGFYVPQPAYEYGVSKVSGLIQSMNDHYGDLCKEFQVELVNPFETFLNRLDYFSDEVHPNQQGYDELAKLFINTLI